MKLIPYERFVIKSPLTADEAIAKLNEYVEPKESRRWLGIEPDKRYEGNINGFDFQITRAIIIQNKSFYPTISGKIKPEIDGCSIYVSILPKLLILLFMLQFLVPSGLLFLYILFSFIGSVLGINKDNLTSGTEVFWFGVFFYLIYIFLVGPFKAEAGVSKEFFQKLFRAKETTEIGFIGLLKTG